MSTLMVTGACGFIGSAVMRCLSRHGFAVRGMCHQHRTPPHAVPNGVSWRHADVRDGDALANVLAGVDSVVHLAGPPSVAESFRTPREFVRTHVEGTVAVLDACRRAGVRRFVFLSSGEVYGSPGVDLVDEGHPCQPRSPYGACKLAAEHMVRVHAATGALATTILRAFSVYGPGQSPFCVTAEILRQAGHGDRVQLADPRAVRDFTHVDDIAAAIVLAVRGDSVPLRVLNLGSGVGISIGELARRVLFACGRAGVVCTSAESDRPASAACGRLVADVRRAEIELGWRPRIGLAEGLQGLVRESPLVKHA